MSTPAYEVWKQDPTPDNLAGVMAELEPTINAEVHRYTGPKPLLRGHAKQLAIQAIKTYQPGQGAQLRSWVVTQLQPLSRYGQQLRPVKVPEMALRQAAQVDRVQRELSDTLGREPELTELADEIGISPRRIEKLRKMVKPVLAEGSLHAIGDEDEAASAPGIETPHTLSTVEEVVYQSLSPRDRQIFDLKTGKHGATQLANQDIARRLGVTPALISQRSQQIAAQIADLDQKGVL